MSHLRIGMICPLGMGPRNLIERAHGLGLTGAQLNCWDMSLYTDELAEQAVAASKEFDIEINTVWAGVTGRNVWNFAEGPATIGIVPRTTRRERLGCLKLGADFAKKISVRSITTHVGFIPENAGDKLYAEVVEALREIAAYCRDLDLEFWFETGQETPITLLRTIEDVGGDHLGINLDPANLILYGKANPVDALDIFGRYVRGVHAKDGFYPTNGRELGKEVPIGQGMVDFPKLVSRLKEFGFDGHVTIEREIEGPQQIEDIKASIEMLRPLC